MAEGHGRVGTTVRGKYRVDAFLATGTMANVYACTHRNGSRVALKILHRELASDKQLSERFKREGYFANAIGHRGIVKAIDDDVTEDGCAFIVMELLEGETLEERRKRSGGRIAVTELLPIADQLLEVIAAAHEKGVLHRDMKPENVFLTKDGDVKVLDFGVARFDDGKSSSDMTAVGMVLGTPAYMPPEQALGRRADVDQQSDLWATGATLFTALTGENVHSGGDAKAKLIKTARTPARPLRDVAPDVPRPVAQVIDRALAFHKDERWPDASAMREALRWAKMTLEREGTLQPSLTPEAVPTMASPTTRRGKDDEPTVMRRYGPEDEPQPQPPSVFTSAPPITQRTPPPPRKPMTSDPTLEGPTAASATPSSLLGSGPVFSLRNDPVFSLRRTKEKDDDAPPETQRLQEEVTIARRPAEDEPRSIEVNLHFTRPMAALVMPDDADGPDEATAKHRPVEIRQTVDLPENAVKEAIAKHPTSSGHDMTLPLGVQSPSIQTLPGFGPPPASMSPPFGSDVLGPGAVIGSSEPGARVTGQMSTVPTPLQATIQAEMAMQTSSPPTSTTPGAALSEVIAAPKKGQGFRVAMILLVGLLVIGGGAAWFFRGRLGVVIARVTPPTQAHPQPPAVAAPPPTPSAATSIAADTPPPTADPAPPPPPTAVTSAAASAAPARSATAVTKKPRPKRKPKPPPVDTAAAATDTAAPADTDKLPDSQGTMPTMPTAQPLAPDPPTPAPASSP